MDSFVSFVQLGTLKAILCYRVYMNFLFSDLGEITFTYEP